MLEIERRYSLNATELSPLVSRLYKLGFVEKRTSQQKDTYYTSRHKDFIASEECLRIRTDENGVIVTWKPPSTHEMDSTPEFWKEEIDLVVTGQEDTVKRLLLALDFVEYVTVAKHRRTFVDGDDVEIALDHVENVGDFIEIEIKSTDIAAARAKLGAIGMELELDDSRINKVPYRDLVPRSVAG